MVSENFVSLPIVSAIDNAGTYKLLQFSSYPKAGISSNTAAAALNAEQTNPGAPPWLYDPIINQVQTAKDIATSPSIASTQSEISGTTNANTAGTPVQTVSVPTNMSVPIPSENVGQVINDSTYSGPGTYVVYVAGQVYNAASLPSIVTISNFSDFQNLASNLAATVQYYGAAGTPYTSPFNNYSPITGNPLPATVVYPAGANVTSAVQQQLINAVTPSSVSIPIASIAPKPVSEVPLGAVSTDASHANLVYTTPNGVNIYYYYTGQVPVSSQTVAGSGATTTTLGAVSVATTVATPTALAALPISATYTQPGQYGIYDANGNLVSSYLVSNPQQYATYLSVYESNPGYYVKYVSPLSMTITNATPAAQKASIPQISLNNFQPTTTIPANFSYFKATPKVNQTLVGISTLLNRTNAVTSIFNKSPTVGSVGLSSFK